MGSGNVKKFEVKLGRTGLIIVIGGMTVLLCLSFVLGVGVGKNIDTYPHKISSVPQQVLALFWRPAKIAVQQKNTEVTEAQPEKSKMDLTFHDALTGQVTMPIQQLPAAAKKQDSTPVMEQKIETQKLPTPAPLPLEKKAVTITKESSEQKVTIKEKSPVEKKSKIKEASTPGHPAASLFLVHVASLKDKAKATQIHKSVATMGYPSKNVKVDIKGKGTWYRIIVTGFETRAQAQAAADRISKKVKTHCIIRPAEAYAGKNQ